MPLVPVSRFTRSPEIRKIMRRFPGKLRKALLGEKKPPTKDGFNTQLDGYFGTLSNPMPRALATPAP